MDKNQILKLFRITEDQYAHLQFELGLNYLESICTSEGIRSEISYSALYWDWWRRQWQQIDEYFIAHINVHCVDQSRFSKRLYEQYCAMHLRPHHISDRFMQDEIANDYNNMIREIIKNSLNKEVL